MESVTNVELKSAPPRHAVVLTWVLAAAYLLVIFYASVQPFRDWRLPAADVYGFLTAPWPKYITLPDVLINVVAYMPLGFLVAFGLRLSMPPAGAVLAGFAFAVALSIGMEALQMFLPARRASNVDVLANGAGGLAGALAAPLFLPARALGARLTRLRDQWFTPGALTDAGMVVALLWVVAHLNPYTQAFGTGHLRETFELPALFFHTPGLLLSAEATVVFFNLAGVGLLLSTLLKRERHPALLIAGVIVAALAAKMLISAVLGKSQGVWAWLTPGVMLGLLLGATLLAGLLALGRISRLILATLSLLLALAVINLAPDNPYFSLPEPLTSGRASHVLSFSSILRALSELWPLLALAYLSTALWVAQRRL